MPRSTRTVRVAAIDHEVMRFCVESWSKPKQPHLVDLLACDGAGACSCTDWVTRRGPAIKEGKPHGTPETMCRHVNAARRFFLNRLLSQMAEQYGHQ